MKTFKHFKCGTNEGLELEGVEITSTPMVCTPKSLPADIVAVFEKRLADEYTAHYTYRNAANWCKNANYKKAAAYFEGEAAEELEHAKGLQDYLTQWNILPQIPAVIVPNEFDSLVGIIDEAYDIEYKLLQSYSAMQHALCDVHPATFNFIQKYVDIQNESVGAYSDLLNALMLIDIDSKLDLLFFEERYF